MSNGARSSACTALTNDPLPKILALRRNMDSQTYSGSIEEADIYDSFATMEPPIRFSFRAPSKRFFSAIVLSQLTLLSTVVALVLFIANAHTVTNEDRTGYVIWLVFSACGTFFFTLMAVIYWTQRRKLRFMQSKLKLMQLDAEAHGSQKRLETALSVPQLRAETDHRQSVLIQYPGAEETPDTDATASRNSVMLNSTIIGRRRRGTTNASSTAAGEGCELVHFQTHLSGASSSGTRNRDDGGDEATAAAAVSGASALSSTASSSPDYGIILPTFPLPPTHARFSHDHGPLGEGDVADSADGAAMARTTTVLEPLAEGGAGERRRDSHVDVEEQDGEGEDSRQRSAAARGTGAGGGGKRRSVSAAARPRSWFGRSEEGKRGEEGAEMAALPSSSSSSRRSSRALFLGEGYAMLFDGDGGGYESRAVERQKDESGQWREGGEDGVFRTSWQWI
ncbi:hypothetical protein SLS56_007653 [Neofusicoccum ribis]|uniref:Uncharacterized protein n=1 Tax=Neofusicoccum ribis TaxID=45134 RepID=A0ABR3SME1_9PEZI